MRAEDGHRDQARGIDYLASQSDGAVFPELLSSSDPRVVRNTIKAIARRRELDLTDPAEDVALLESHAPAALCGERAPGRPRHMCLGRRPRESPSVLPMAAAVRRVLTGHGLGASGGLL